MKNAFFWIFSPFWSFPKKYFILWKTHIFQFFLRIWCQKYWVQYSTKNQRQNIQSWLNSKSEETCRNSLWTTSLRKNNVPSSKDGKNMTNKAAHQFSFLNHKEVFYNWGFEGEIRNRKIFGKYVMGWIWALY